ncbi:adenylosuccinate lyase [candidate division KSB1 bacterium]|nr:adenylosuccinate lyase [candidate division KSB1 bacterium]
MAGKTIIQNVLASRYASSGIIQYWSEEGKIILEREFWIAVMKAQRELGLDIPTEAIEAYEKVRNQVDLARIRIREEKLRHDVKARIEEFCELAGYEHIHKGLTSRDLTDNIEQLQIFRSLQLIEVKCAACLYQLAQQAAANKDILLTGRTHNVPAQLTTWGKRLAMFGQDMLIAFQNFSSILAKYPLRGIKGAVGTQLDQLTLFEGDKGKVRRLEEKIAAFLGFQQVLFAVGQVYPRSLDFEVIAALFQLSAGISSFARTIRLMAGQELASEGFKKGQVGSSSMPHKMNSRSCERINGLQVVLKGFVEMAMGLSGEQWNEGDVSCSVVRRVALPDALFTIDGIMETFLTVLQEMGIFPSMITHDLNRNFPFLATTTILMEAIKHGAGREEAHAAIKEHSIAVLHEMRQQGKTENELFKRLAADERIPYSLEEMNALLNEHEKFIGNAVMQTEQFVSTVGELVKRFPQALEIKPEPML